MTTTASIATLSLLLAVVFVAASVPASILFERIQQRDDAIDVLAHSASEDEKILALHCIDDLPRLTKK